METRSLILQKAAELLAASPTGDVSTRAVCEAAGVTQPVLYRLFGDKDGLLAAVVDTVWNEYLGTKRAATPGPDPVEDLRAGWDAHTAFALAHPHAYRLLFGTSLSTRPESAAEAMGLLRGILDRVAEQGRLAMAPAEAARLVMAANSGVALGLILQPDSFPDATASRQLRDTIVRSLVTDPPTSPASAAPVAATTLRAHLGQADQFTPAEAGLLDEWLERIQNTQGEDS